MAPEYYENYLSGEIMCATTEASRPNRRFWKRISEERYKQLRDLYNSKPQLRIG